MTVYRLVATALICLSIAGCSSENATISGGIPSGDPSSTGSSLLDSLRPPRQFMTVSGAKGGELKGRKGTRLSIPAYAFITLDGNPVAGEVQIELREALSSRDIVCSGLQTVAHDGKLLETGGMIYLDARAEGQPLKIASGKKILTEVPTASFDERMMIWDGVEQDGEVVWENPRKLETPAWRTEDALVILDQAGDTLGPRPKIEGYEPEQYVEVLSGETASGFQSTIPQAYTFSIIELGWTNIDALNDSKNVRKIRFSVAVERSVEYDSVIACLSPRRINSYISGYQLGNGLFTFKADESSEFTELPVGEKATLIFFGFKGNETYLGIREVIFGEKDVETISLQRMTLDEMQSELGKAL